MFTVGETEAQSKQIRKSQKGKVEPPADPLIPEGKGKGQRAGLPR